MYPCHGALIKLLILVMTLIGQTGTTEVITVDGVEDAIDICKGAFIQLTPGNTYTVTMEGDAYLGQDIEATGVLCLTWEDNEMPYRQYRRIHHLGGAGDSFTFVQNADLSCGAETWFYAVVPDHIVIEDNWGGYTLRFTSPDEPEKTLWVDAKAHAIDVTEGAAFLPTPGETYSVYMDGMAYIGGGMEASGLVCLTWDVDGDPDHQWRRLRIMEWPESRFTYTTVNDGYLGTKFFAFILDCANLADNSGAYTLSIDPADLEPPGNVMNLSVQTGDASVNLSWLNPSDTDFSGVRVCRKTDSYPSEPYDGNIVFDGTESSFEDTGLTNGETYFYGAFSYDEVPNFSTGSFIKATPEALPVHEDHLIAGSMPEGLVLLPISPNPARDRAKIQYGLPTAGHADLILYDIRGRQIMEVFSGHRGAGYHELTVDIFKLPAGIFFLRLTSATTSRVSRLLKDR